MSRPAVRRPVRLLAAATLACAAPATAQQVGLPVDYSPSHLPVRGVLVDGGIGSGYAGTGSLISLGGRLQTAFDNVQMFAGAHAVWPDAEDLGTGLGIELAIARRLLVARPRRVANLQAGIAWTDFDNSEDEGGITIIDVPVGVSLGAYLPTPAGPAEAWVAPRLHVRWADIDGRDVDGGTAVGPGLSAGLRFTTASPQIGGSIAVDGMGLHDPAENGWRFLGAASLTVHLLLLR